jgi:hypothetical protein
VTDKPDRAGESTQPVEAAPPTQPWPPPPSAPQYGTPQQYGTVPEYGTPPPPAPQQPYQQQPYPQPPYASQGYGALPPGPDALAAQGVRSQAIVSLVANGLVLLFSCGTGLVSLAGAIVAGVALSRTRTDPGSARRLVRTSWILLGVQLALGLVIVVLGVIFLVAGA